MRWPLTLQSVEESAHVEAADALGRVVEDAEAEGSGAGVCGAVAVCAVDEDALEGFGRAVFVELRPRQQRARDARAPERELARAVEVLVVLRASGLRADVGVDLERERAAVLRLVLAGVEARVRLRRGLAAYLLELLDADSALLLNRVLALAERVREFPRTRRHFLRAAHGLSAEGREA